MILKLDYKGQIKVIKLMLYIEIIIFVSIQLLDFQKLASQTLEINKNKC